MKLNPEQVLGKTEYPLWEGMTKELKAALREPGMGLSLSGPDYDIYQVVPLGDRKPLSRPAFDMIRREFLRQVHKEQDPDEGKFRQRLSYLPYRIPFGLYEDSFDLQMAVDTFLACSDVLRPDDGVLLALSENHLTFWDHP